MSERKTVKVNIVTGYVPEATSHRKNYVALIFAAFWRLAR